MHADGKSVFQNGGTENDAPENAKKFPENNDSGNETVLWLPALIFQS